MPQVSAALAAHSFYAHHAMAGVAVLGNGLFAGWGVKAGPAAARIKLGGRVEEFGIAADAVVAAVFPMVFVFTRERALGRGFARDFKGHRLGIFGGQEVAPFLFGFLDGHEEQLISMDEAHSGARPAQAS